MTSTILDCLVESLRARRATPDGQTVPCAVLWLDPKEEWLGLRPTLRATAPEVLALGEYDPDAGVGPAIWLRCVVDGILPAPGGCVGAGEDAAGTSETGATGDSDDDPIPILYLPGVKREDLRAGADCPDHVKPLVELMYRGTLWHHPNGRPWTPVAFLGSEAALDLDIASDQRTHRALTSALAEVAALPLSRFQGHRWDADDFRGLLSPDLARDVLQWMADAAGMRDRLSDNGWGAFCDRCRSELEFDPQTDADVVAGLKLARGTSGWASVWERFAEVPGIHPGVVEVLRRSRPSGEITLEPDRWPDLNEEMEAAARKALAAVPQLPSNEAREVLARLENEHAPRRKWLWASLGQSPVAQLLEPLARLAEAACVPFGGNTPSEAADAYADQGWRADAAAREALAGVAPKDEEIVAQVVRRLLEPWMEAGARAFQSLLDRSPLPDLADQSPVAAAADECVVFVDGLRYELGRDLAERLGAKGCTARVDRRWAALPTVTATGKPAVAPVADQVAGGALGPDFRPVLLAAEEPRAADAARLREATADRGYQVFLWDSPEMPRSADARGWMEAGKIDKLGHYHANDAAAFARAVEDELKDLVRSIEGLLELGWRSVRVVTDHGWLWLPGGLPMVSLPRHLTASKWARCAAISGDSKPVDALRFPWRWNAAQWFAAPPGIACFSKRDAYAHGGVSLQECLIPDIRVEQGDAPAPAWPSATVQSVTWRRLRCFAVVEATGGPVFADLRLGGPSGPSVAATPKPVADDGSASLVLTDDEHENAALAFVVLDADGRVLAHRSTRPGAAS